MTTQNILNYWTTCKPAEVVTSWTWCLTASEQKITIMSSPAVSPTTPAAVPNTSVVNASVGISGSNPFNTSLPESVTGKFVSCLFVYLNDLKPICWCESLMNSTSGNCVCIQFVYSWLGFVFHQCISRELSMTFFSFSHKVWYIVHLQINLLINLRWKPKEIKKKKKNQLMMILKQLCDILLLQFVSYLWIIYITLCLCTAETIFGFKLTRF